MPRPLTYELEEAGKRLAGAANLLIACNDPWELRSKVLAIKLQDGSTDGNVYDSQYDAVRHSDPMRCMYFHFRGNLGGVSPREAAIMLQFHREAREAGVPQADPDNKKRQPVPILSHYGHDVYSRIQRATAN